MSHRLSLTFECAADNVQDIPCRSTKNLPLILKFNASSIVDENLSDNILVGICRNLKSRIHYCSIFWIPTVTTYQCYWTVLAQIRGMQALLCVLNVGECSPQSITKCSRKINRGSTLPEHAQAKAQCRFIFILSG